MAIWQKSQKLNTVDDAVRPGLGTVGGDHITPGSVQAHNINQNILPFDRRVQYFGGPNSGTWSLNVNAGSNYRFNTFARTTTPQSQITVNFVGPRIEVYGVMLEAGGKFDVFLDGVLQVGTVPTVSSYIPATIPTGQQVPPTNNQVSALNSTTPTITVVASTSFGAGPGIIRIENELIQYTAYDGATFTGCTRGALGTLAVTHVEGTPVYGVSATVDTYSPRRAYRRALWVGDNLGQGAHTLIIQMRSDFNVAVTIPELRIECFTQGSLISGTALNFYTDQTNLFTSHTMDGTGNYLAGGLSSYINTNQLVSILGITDDSHALTYQIDNSGNLWIHGAPSTTYTNCYMTALFAQDSI